MIPPTAAAAVALPKSSRASTLGSRAWTWVSITPGMRILAGRIEAVARLGHVTGAPDGDDPALGDRQLRLPHAIRGDEGGAADQQFGLHRGVRSRS